MWVPLLGTTIKRKSPAMLGFLRFYGPFLENCPTSCPTARSFGYEARGTTRQPRHTGGRSISGPRRSNRISFHRNLGGRPT